LGCADTTFRIWGLGCGETSFANWSTAVLRRPFNTWHQDCNAPKTLHATYACCLLRLSKLRASCWHEAHTGHKNTHSVGQHTERHPCKRPSQYAEKPPPTARPQHAAALRHTRHSPRGVLTLAYSSTRAPCVRRCAHARASQISDLSQRLHLYVSACLPLANARAHTHTYIHTHTGIGMRHLIGGESHACTARTRI